MDFCKYFGKAAQMTAFFGLDGKGRDPFYFVCVVAAHRAFYSEKWSINGLVQEYGKFPVSGEKYRGDSLGSWSGMQKFLARNTEYSPERKQMLADLGIFHTTQDARWERQYQLLEAFVAEYGRLPKQKEQYHDEPLGIWCAMQKQRCKKESYPAERKAKLRDIGLIPGNSLSFF